MQRAIFKRSGLILCCGFISLAQATPADDGVNETVIVLAEKREAFVEDVPIAMSAVTGEQLQQAGITDVDGLAEHLPALGVQRNSGLTTTSLRVRRVGNIGNIPIFEPAVGVFVDGAFRSRSFLGASNWLAVDHVELLRGPQTVLYGKNVSAGLLAIYTRRPGERLSVTGELTQGWIDSPDRAGLSTATFDLSGPVASKLSGGIAAQLAQHGHTLRNVLAEGPDGDNERQSAVRAQLAWTPSDALDVRLLLGYMRERDDQGESDVYLAPGAGSTQVADLLRQLGLAPRCVDNVPRNRTLCSVATNKMRVETEDVTLLGKYSLPNDWTLKSMTSADRYEIFRIEDDAIQLFAPMLFYRDAEDSRSVQEELRIESDDGDLAWLIGGFYYRNVFERGDGGRKPMFGANGELAYNPFWPRVLGIPLAVPGQLGIHDSRLDSRYVSAFGQATWRMSRRWSLTAGLRWQKEEKDADINNSVTVPGPSLISLVLTPTTTLTGEPVNGSLHRASENVPWTITPQYRFSDDAMAYFTISRGYKSGSFNTGFGDAALNAREFADETIQHREIGLKTSFADRKWMLSAAAFRTRYDDYQDSAFISAQFSVGNAERVDLEGVEIEGTAVLTERLKLGAALSRADLRYRTNTDGLCSPNRIPDGSSPNSCVLSGLRPIHAPEWEAHLDLQYYQPVTWGEISARLDWSWSDDYNTSFSADPRLVQGDYSDVALRIGAHIADKYDVVLWANNLLDENVSHFDSLLNLFNDASYQSFLAAPRSYGLSLRFRL